MIIGEITARSSPTVQIPLWDQLNGNGHHPIPSSPIHSPFSPSVNLNVASNVSNADYFTDFATLQRHLPSNEGIVISCAEFDSLSDSDSDLPPIDAFSCDYFRMYEFKVRRCARGRSHDWTECPYAHPGEKARRRDPRKYHYSGTACPDFRKGNCKRGDSCEFAHGVFECWLHPARYRTQPCKDGVACSRRVCFFAHTPEQLRILPQQQQQTTTYPDSEMGSPPIRHRFDGFGNSGSKFVSSPTSILASPPLSPGSDSPPMSPSECSRLNSVNELANSMRRLQVGNVKIGSYGFGSPRGSILRQGFCSMPTTRCFGLSQLDAWESGFEEEPAMERVESGRDVRARIYAKLSEENSLDRVDAAGSGPDVAWICELVK